MDEITPMQREHYSLQTDKSSGVDLSHHHFLAGFILRYFILLVHKEKCFKGRECRCTNFTCFKLYKQSK